MSERRKEDVTIPAKDNKLVQLAKPSTQNQKELVSSSKLNFIELCIKEVDSALKCDEYYATESEKSWKFPHLKFRDVNVDNYVSSVRSRKKSSEDKYKNLVEVLVDRLNFVVIVITGHLKTLRNIIIVIEDSSVVKRKPVEHIIKYWHYSTKFANDMQILFENLFTIKCLLNENLEKAESDAIELTMEQNQNSISDTPKLQKSVLTSITCDTADERKCVFDIRFKEIVMFVKHFFLLLTEHLTDFKPSILDIKIEKGSSSMDICSDITEIFCKAIESDFQELFVYVNKSIALDSSYRDMESEMLELRGRLEEELKEYKSKMREKENIISERANLKLTNDVRKRDYGIQTDENNKINNTETLEKLISLYSAGESILTQEISEIRLNTERLKEENVKLENLAKSMEIANAAIIKEILDGQKNAELKSAALEENIAAVNTDLKAALEKYLAQKTAAESKDEIIKDKNAEILALSRKVANRKQLIQDMLFNPEVGEPETTLEEPKPIRETLQTQMRVNSARITALEDMNSALTRAIKNREKPIQDPPS